ncbi:MAG: hypothetical protein CMJ36_04480 [Phycisphaerae bacterium]|nr:hypothetical protein [Phycisphaerae bacterium]
MPLERVFLGTGRHCLHAVAEHLLHRRPHGSGEWNLEELLLVLPSARAMRRLGSLLLQRASEQGVLYVPPTMTTPGGLPSAFLAPRLPRPDPISDRLSWIQVLRDASRVDLKPLLGEDEQSEASLEELARRLSNLSRELGGAGLQFEDVLKSDAITGSFEEDRWAAMHRLQVTRTDLLARCGLEEQDLAVQQLLLEPGSFQGTRFQQLGYISADLNALQRGFLDLLSSHGVDVFSMIHADESQSDLFDDHGCVMPEHWMHRAMPIDEQMLRIVDGPGEQALTVIELLGSLEEVDTVDCATIGVPDPDLLPGFSRLLPSWGVPVHDHVGKPAGRSSLCRLLVAVEKYLAHGTASDLSPLLRHPIIEAWLATGPGVIEDPIDAYADYLEECVPLELPTFLPDRHRDLAIAIRPLLQQLHPMRHAVESVSDRAELLRGLLESWLTPSFESLSEEDHAACELIIERLGQLAQAPPEIAGSMSAAGMLRLILSSLETSNIRSTRDENSVELIGWLDCHLDDAPVLLVSGCNEGVLPRSINADPFLPNELRRSLGLVDNDRRYARDAFLMEAIIKSGRTVRFILGRQGSEGDPLKPSRLLLASDDDQIAPRVLLVSKSPSSAPVLPAHGSGDGGFLKCPMPTSTPAVQRMSVTSFRSYIACPYRYMLRYVLRLRTREDPPSELEGGAFGTLAHDVLEQFGRQEIDLQSPYLDAAIVKKELDSILDGLIHDRLGRSILPSVRLQFETLRRRLHAYAPVHVAEAEAGWKIHAVEKSFGDRKGNDHPAAALPGEPRIRLTGKIDRIDEHPEHGYRAIDFKTSDKGKGVESVHRSSKTGRWHDLQMPLYRHLMASIALHVEPANLCFIELPAKMDRTRLDRPKKWNDDILLAADDVARQIVSDIMEAKFEPNPDFKAHWDDWAWICGTGVIELEEEEADS